MKKTLLALTMALALGISFTASAKTEFKAVIIDIGINGAGERYVKVRRTDTDNVVVVSHAQVGESAIWHDHAIMTSRDILNTLINSGTSMQWEIDFACSDYTEDKVWGDGVYTGYSDCIFDY